MGIAGTSSAITDTMRPTPDLLVPGRASSRSRGLDVDLIDPPFYQHVAVDGPCVIVDKKPEGNGYARVVVNGRRVLAHRAAYEAAYGPIPPGVTVEHLCRVRLCVAPMHLELATPSENSSRARAGRYQRTCWRGHSDWTVLSTGERKCRPCVAIRQAAYYRRHYEPRVREPRTICRMGHPLIGNNLATARPGSNERVCRECRRTYLRAYRRRLAAPTLPPTAEGGHE